MKLSALLQEVEIQTVSTVEDVEIRGVTDRVQDVQPGDAFVCIPGRTTDGHDFAEEAARRGAAVLIVRHPVGGELPQVAVADPRAALARMCGNLYGNPARRMTLAAVTGTNGKTTVAWMLRHIWTAAGYRSGCIGTIGEDSASLQSSVHYTTPAPPMLHRILARQAEAGTHRVVMEASSQALEQQRLAGLRFACGIFTQLTPEHMDVHGTMEHYYRAKRSLFARCGCAVICIDSLWGIRLTREVPCRVWTVSAKYPTADYYAEQIAPCSGGTAWTLCHRGQKFPVRLPMPGAYNAVNAMCAAAAAEVCGGELGRGLASLADLPAIPGRTQRIAADVPFQMYIDYAHTPAALETVLQALRPACAGRLVTVFGCGGDRDRTKRPEMGRIAEQYSDVVILTDDNPRSEDRMQIFGDIEAGMTPGRYRRIPHRPEAIDTAVREAGAGDLILIAGKGHEQYQILDDGVYPLNEYRIAQAAAEKWKKERNDESWNRFS